MLPDLSVALQDLFGRADLGSSIQAVRFFTAILAAFFLAAHVAPPITAFFAGSSFPWNERSAL